MADEKEKEGEGARGTQGGGGCRLQGAGCWVLAAGGVGQESGTCFAHLPMNVSKQRVRGKRWVRAFFFSVLPPRPGHKTLKEINKIN